MKRVKVNSKKPNPLFEQWLIEFRDIAKERGSDSWHSINNALTSLRKYPLTFKSGKECGLLKHFGPKLCKMLDKKLAEYIKQNPGVNLDEVAVTVNCNRDAASKTTSKRLNNGGQSRKRAEPRKNCKKTTAVTSSKEQSVDEEAPEPIDVCFRAGEATVFLIVDSGETSKGSLKHASKVATMKELLSQGIPHHIRNLSVGDFIWIVQDGDKELVLPYVVERKRTDDLARSIKDNRYREQKMRLGLTGLNVIYLIEVLQSNHLGLSIDALQQAEVNTEVQDNFCIHRTTGPKDTVSYLNTMTKALQRKITNKTLKNCIGEQKPVFSFAESTLYLLTFAEFNGGYAKLENFTVQEMFAQQLLQVSGLSVDMVFEIVNKYHTPWHLRQTYLSCKTEAECINVLTSLQHGPNKTSLSANASRRIWLLFTSNSFKDN